MIEYRNYSFTYAGSERPVLQDINLTFQEGGFYLLCGQSGCGKTTLLLQMLNTMRPHGTCRGEISYQGKSIAEIDKLTAASQIGYVGQDPDAMLVTDKVWHELAFGLESLGLNLNEMKRKVGEIAQFFGLEDRLLQDTATLSGGQKQLVVLASVMAMQPKVLLLDEPTAQLDPLAATEFLHTIKRLNEELGTTVILCEHRLEEIFSLSDEVILMSRGRIEQIGIPKAVAEYLLEKGQSARLYEGLPTPVRIAGGLYGHKGDCPINLKEGRLWFENFWIQHPDFKQRVSLRKAENFEQEAKVLEGRELEFSYEPGKEVLRKADFCLHEKEWYCLMGGNGAGKSTLLSLIVGNEQAASGSLFYQGISCSKKHPLPLGFGGVVLLPQNPKALFSEITAREELEVMVKSPYRNAAKRGSESSADRAGDPATEVDAMLQTMELSDVALQHPYDLSGGQQQKLALAKLLLLKPKVLLLDEPTKGMDPGFKPEFAVLISELKNQGKAIFMVSHDVEFAAEYADTCGLLFDGEIVAQSPAGEFFAGNNFYTTGTNRMVRKYLPKAVTVKEVTGCTTD